MSAKEFHRIAVVLPMFYRYARNVMRGVEEWADLNPSWHCIELDTSQATLSSSLAACLDGVILWHTDESPISPLVRGLRLPTVEVGLPVDEAKTSPNPRISGVSFDRRSINRLAIGHFQALGLQSVGYLGIALRHAGRLAARVSDMRREAYAAGMEWAEFDAEGFHPAFDPSLVWRGGEVPGFVDYLKGVAKPAGLLAQDDYLGCMACETARGHGIRVPEDLAVLGQGNRLIGRSGPVSLSTVEIPGEAIGREAAAMLAGWILHGKPKQTVRSLPCESLLIRHSTGGKSRDASIERARRHIERHAADGVTVGELAEMAGCSPNTFRKKFLGEYGMEPSVMVRQRREKLAFELLADTDIELRDIAGRCGFTSPSNFFNFVKRRTGMGPAQYRLAAKTRTAEGTSQETA